MLGQRIVTAVVLLALLVPAMLSTAEWPFLALTMLLVAAAGWEWARLNAAGSVAELIGSCIADAEQFNDDDGLADVEVFRQHRGINA